MAVIISILLLIALTGEKVSCRINNTGCQGLTYTVNAALGEKRDLFSPGYEKGVYPDLAYCVYTIKASSGLKVKLTFKNMDIDPFGMCGKDRIFVFDGESMFKPMIGVYCGDEVPNPIVSSGNSLTFSFHSDHITGKKGFHSQYEAMSGDLCQKGYIKCKNNNCYKSTDKCNGNDECGDGTDEENCRLPVTSFPCGNPAVEPYNSTEGNDRIIGGKEVRKGSWPWQADMQLKMYTPNGHTCGGTLIHPQWVMSAFHCLMSSPVAEGWRIHLGNHHKYKKDEHEQIRLVERIVVYPGHTGKDIEGKPIDIVNDIALFKLNAPVRITDYVKPACLPPKNYELPELTVCQSTGWGTTRGTGSDDVLKQVDMTVRAGQQCPGFRNGTMICLRNQKGFQDVCHGDSGGPLNCKISGKWHVTGIASFVTSSNMLGGLCAMPKSGAVYNKVSVKTDWIQDMLSRFS